MKRLISGDCAEREILRYEGRKAPQDEVEVLFGFRVHVARGLPPGVLGLAGVPMLRRGPAGDLELDAGLSPLVAIIEPIG